MSGVSSAPAGAAWSRLGAKLKGARASDSNHKDISTATDAIPVSSTKSSKAKASTNLDAQSRSSNGNSTPPDKPKDKSKKRKRHAEKDTPVATAIDSSHPQAGLDHSTAETPTDDSAKRLKRKKSVTFTNDTKTTDGDTAPSVPATPPASKSKKSRESADTVIADSPAPTSPTPATTVPKAAKSKTKTRNPKARPSSSAPEAPYITYLTTHHTSISTWKFNKAKQTDLLKNLWNLFRVPSTHNQALVSYLSGLQGAGVRERLAQQCRDVLAEERRKVLERLGGKGKAGMATLQGRTKSREQAAKMFIAARKKTGLTEAEEEELMKELKLEKDKAERAERVLVEALGLEMLEKTPKLEGRKGRKSRTEVESDSSDSSSDSESDSDSDSDSDSSSSSSSKKNTVTPKTFDEESKDEFFPKKDYPDINAQAAEVKRKR